MGYKYSQYRKRHQRAVNKLFRELNKGLEDDDLWHGRFVAVQDSSWFKQYEDKSGYYLYVVYHFVDKKTGQKSWRQYCEDANWLCNSARLWWQMNDFIVKECDTWKYERNDPNYPCNDKTNYRNVKIP